MTSIPYFGALPAGNQLATEENRSRGINLIRKSPWDLQIHAQRTFTSPSYELYINYFPYAVQAARTGIPVDFGPNRAIYYHDGKTLTPFFRNPTLLWSYGEKKSQDILDTYKERFNAAETVDSRGKPALTAILSREQVRSLIRDTSPLETAKANLSTMDVASYKVYVKLHVYAHTFFRIQQYSLLKSSDSTYDKRSIELVAMEEASLLKSTSGAGA